MDDLGVPLFLETPLSNLSARRAAFFGGALACGGRKVGKCPPGKKNDGAAATLSIYMQHVLDWDIINTHKNWTLVVVEKV